mmetsp:Transcript_2330/g.4889  ORF Transcript_2330/g.4889 Transcript_2330/m.4889 type:complete len:200 (+) Transcript_2330:789-1388(+)
MLKLSRRLFDVVKNDGTQLVLATEVKPMRVHLGGIRCQAEMIVQPYLDTQVVFKEVVVQAPRRLFRHHHTGPQANLVVDPDRLAVPPPTRCFRDTCMIPTLIRASRWQITVICCSRQTATTHRRRKSSSPTLSLHCRSTLHPLQRSRQPALRLHSVHTWVPHLPLRIRVHQGKATVALEGISSGLRQVIPTIHCLHHLR